MTTPAQAWPAVLLVAAGTFTMVTLEFLPIGLLQSLAAAYRVSIGNAGLLVTLPGTIAAISAPLFAVLGSALPRQRLLAGLMAVLAISALDSALAASFTAALAARALLGLTVGGLWTYAAATARRFVAPAHAPRAMAIVLAGISVGSVLGVPLGTWLGHQAGWRTAFAAAGALALLILLAQLWVLPRGPRAAATGWRDLAGLLTVATARHGLWIAGLLAAAHFAAYTFLEPTLRQLAGIGDAGVTACLAGYGVAGLLGTFVGERIASRNPALCLLLAALLLAGLLALIALAAPPAWFSAALVLLWGAAFGAVPIGIQLWLLQAAPDRFEAGSAVLVTVFQIFLALGSWGGGLAEQRAGLRAPLLTGSAIALLAAVAIVLLSQRQAAARPHQTNLTSDTP